MKSPLAKWGMVFALCYLGGWMILLPRFEAWWDAVERRGDLEKELPALRQAVKHVDDGKGGGRSERERHAFEVIQHALKAAGLGYERIDPDRRALERGQIAFTVQILGEADQLVAFLEQARRTHPRLLVTALDVRGREPGIGGTIQLMALLPSQVKSSAFVSASGRDPFHPLPATPVRTVATRPIENSTPPPPPEPVVLLKLLGMKEVLGETGQIVSEALAENLQTNLIESIKPSQYAPLGIRLEFDVPKGLIRIFKGTSLLKEWRSLETIDQKVLRPDLASQTPRAAQTPTGGQGGETPPPPPDLPPIP